ncbi:MAG: short chain dehydrogenase [Actinobacteria bacterium]|nr:short chain dehydrogenase [Actinomycetota bacterium]
MDKTEILDFSGKTVIVTGGTRGLGRVISESFLDAGANVVTCARNAPEKAIFSELNNNEAVFFETDVRNPDQVDSLISEVIQKFGRIDVLVNNAGGAPSVRSSDASPRFNEKVVSLNLLASMYCSQSVFPVMTAQEDNGVIINISSVSGSRPNPSGMAYGAAKAGLDNLSKTLAHEWSPKIRVLTLAVGLIETDESSDFYGDDEKRLELANHLAMKRLGKPEEIADMCLVLASPLARWMTGTTVEVHGGGESPFYLKEISEMGTKENT